MNTYLNPQMLSLEELHEAHLEKAKKYLETKWDASYYKFEPPQYEYDDYEVHGIIEDTSIVLKRRGDLENYGIEDLDN